MGVCRMGNNAYFKKTAKISRGPGVPPNIKPPASQTRKTAREQFTAAQGATMLLGLVLGGIGGGLVGLQTGLLGAVIGAMIGAAAGATAGIMLWH